MIKLNINDKLEASKILELQFLGYKVEAELMGFDGIPQLNDTVETIMDSNETFIGYINEGDLIGVVSFERTDRVLDICRLVIHPDHFRKGIASSLLNYLIEAKIEVERFMVSTGSKNSPAIELYKQFGFVPFQEVEVADGVFITEFERNRKADPNM